ncbi:hexose transporter hxt1 [Coelomomyces lativittatus]|nr:hexose transporter hxt1 [Coelomomyces lativittatus]KAJ1511629.1 hexose transporter hxt1 [Coelomomyces lativittatus]
MGAFKTFFSFNKVENTPSSTLLTPSSYIVASFVLGCIPGALVMSYLAQRIGRKKSVGVGCLFFMLGALLQCTVPSSLSMSGRLILMCVGRGLGGVGVGMLSMSVPMFIAELAPTLIRGKLTSLYQFLITLGIFMASIVNATFIFTLGHETRSNAIWRWALGMQLIPGALLMGLLLFIPESPRWLLSKQKEKEARLALTQLRQASSMQVEEEFQGLFHSLQEDQVRGQASWREVFGPSLRRRVWMAMALQLFQQWTGINAIMYYSAGLYAQLNVDALSASTYLVMVQNLANVLATLPAIFLIERLGRRGLLLWGGVGIEVALISAVICLQFYESSFTFSILSVVSIYIFILFFASTWGPVVWVFQSEIFPQRARERASALATATNWTNNFLITLFYPSLRDLIGTFQLIPFMVMVFFMTVFVYFLVPETKGKTLEEMDEVFHPSSRSEKEV